MVEFSLLLPVFLVILLGVIEFGWALRAYVVEQNAAREGARYWSLNGSPGGCSTIGDQVKDKAPSLYDPADSPPKLVVSYEINGAVVVSPDSSTCSAPTAKPIKVTATYTYSFITPLGAFVSRVAGPWTITSSASMRVE
jgi:Flp pilus assembly protein TadG